MARIFITGSSDGLGQMAAKLLVSEGHEVVLHGRSPKRRQDALDAVSGAAGAVEGDLSTLAGIRQASEEANALGRFDSVIHNAGVYLGPRQSTEDGLERVFAVNVLAPYLLTVRMTRPDRLVYLSSGLQSSGRIHLEDLQWTQRDWSGMQAYSDSKLLVVVLAKAFARLWPDVLSNAVDPGWIATKMGGPGADPDIESGAATQAWLAGSEDEEPSTTSGGYWYRKRQEAPNAEAENADNQHALLSECARISGVTAAA